MTGTQERKMCLAERRPWDGTHQVHVVRDSAVRGPQNRSSAPLPAHSRVADTGGTTRTDLTVEPPGLRPVELLDRANEAVLTECSGEREGFV
jgi:hypothetical protein